MRIIFKGTILIILSSLIISCYIYANEPIEVYTFAATKPRPSGRGWRLAAQYSAQTGTPGFSPGGLHYSQEGKFSIPFGRKYNYADVLVKRVIDGDTLQLENGARVRLIGIDTPEMHESDKLYRDSQRTRQDISTIQKLGRQAYEFTRNFVEGKRVTLEFDVEKHDRYKRLLAYVYLKDGTFVNAEIIRQGYASLMTIPPNVKYAELFLKLYQEARVARRGLWR